MMPARRLPQVAPFAIAACLLLVTFGGAALRAQGAPWRIEQPDVHVVCSMTVGGSFEIKTKALTSTVTGDGTAEAPFSGDISVDLRTLDAGIGLRTRHLQENYLEVGKGEGFDKAVLSQITVKGPDGHATFSGTLRLHGTFRPVTGQAALRRTPGAVRVEAAFPVSVADFGIAEPRYLGVGVKDVVQVKVAFVAKSN